MLHHSKITDERREAGAMECWCLHGAVGAAADWRNAAAALAAAGVGTRAVDLWRFLECAPMSQTDFARALNAEAAGEAARGRGRVLLGYSMGGRLALQALLAGGGPWQAAVIVSAHPGLEHDGERASRRAADAAWGARALTADWQGFLADWSAQPVLRCGAMRDEASSRQLGMRRREIARSFLDWSLGAQQPLWDALHRIDIPVLWIAGERDDKFLALAQRAAALTPHGSLAVAPGAGHRVPWDGPEWFVSTVAGFSRSGGA